MKTLPLYAEVPGSPVETSERLCRDTACTRCALHEGVHTVCVPAAGEPGGLLLVGEGPGAQEDAKGRPFVGASGRALYAAVKKRWTGPIAVANATNCFSGKTKARAALELTPKHVDACRPYLAQVIEDLRPTRILALGKWAARSLTGRAIPPLKTRRGYAHLLRAPVAWWAEERAEEEGTKGDIPTGALWLEEAEAIRDGQHSEAYACAYSIPIFVVMHPTAALRNRLLMRAFEQDLDWALSADPAPLPLHAEVSVVETEEDSASVVFDLGAHERLSVDIEAVGVQHESNYRIVSVAVCPVGRTDSYVWPREVIARQEVMAHLWQLLEDRRVAKTGAHFQYDIIGLWCNGVRIDGSLADVRLWRKLIEPHGVGALDEMAELVGMGGIKEEAEAAMKPIVKRAVEGAQAEQALARRAAQPEKTWPKLSAPKQEGLRYLQQLDREDPNLAALVRRFPSASDESSGKWKYGLVARDAPEVEYRYNARDAVATARLSEMLERRLETEEPEGMRAYRERRLDPVNAAVAHVCRWGFPASRPAVFAFDAYLRAELEPVKARLATYGVENWSSAEQVAEFFFRKVGLKSVKLTKSGEGDSTDKEVLQALRGKHPAVDDLIKYRELLKMMGNYAAGLDGKSGMLAFIREDGRIHPTIFIDGAETGRASCRDPNGQTWPKKNPVMMKLSRDIMAAPPGKLIVSCDFSQVELRVAAELSGDEKMKEIFATGVDYHLRTAQLISRLAWGIAPEDVTDEHRTLSKPVTFGLIYGKGDEGLAGDIFKTDKPTKQQVAQAARIREAVLGIFPGLLKFIEACVRETIKTGEMWVEFDGAPALRRMLWDIADEDDARKSKARNGSFNGPIQGRAALFLNASLTSVVEWILGDGIEDDVKAVLPVHDQILSEVSFDYVDEAVHMIADTMEGQDCGVPLVADAEIGPAWGSLRKLKRTPEGWRCYVGKKDGKDVYTAPMGGPLAAYQAAVQG